MISEKTDHGIEVEASEQSGPPQTPFESANAALVAFAFALQVHMAVRKGAIGLQTLDSRMEVTEPRSGKVTAIVGPTNAHDLHFSSLNVLQATGAALAIALDRALDDRYGAKPSAVNCDLDAIRIVVYMARCAFAHDVMIPRWEVKPAYRRPVLAPQFDLSFDFAQLNGERLHIDHFDGISGVVRLVRAAIGALE